MAAGKSKYLWNLMRIDYSSNTIQRAGAHVRQVDAANAADISTEIENYGDIYDYDGDPNDIGNSFGNVEYGTDSNGVDLTDTNTQYVMLPNENGSVNIVENYTWTFTENDLGRKDVPRIYLKEMQTSSGGDLQNLLYMITLTIDSAKKADKEITGGIGAASLASLASLANSSNRKFNYITGKYDVESNITTGIKTITGKSIDGSKKLINQSLEAMGIDANNKLLDVITEKASDVMKNVGKKIEEVYDKYKSSSEHFTINSPHLRPYNGLYSLNDTGWNFTLPYYNNDIMPTTPNDFNTRSTSYISKIADAARVGTNFITGAVNTIDQFSNNTFTHFEQPKIYTYADGSEAITIKFPLINTESEEDVIKNWQLIQLLKFQSRPYRVSKSTIIPPYFYEVSIPGTRYIPYAFIQNCKIDMVGTRLMRKVVFTHEGKDKEVSTIIPEAYQVEITLRSLTNEPQNFIVEALLNTRNLDIYGKNESNGFISHNYVGSNKTGIESLLGL